jgi:hypothetical protein
MSAILLSGVLLVFLYVKDIFASSPYLRDSDEPLSVSRERDTKSGDDLNSTSYTLLAYTTPTSAFDPDGAPTTAFIEATSPVDPDIAPVNEMVFDSPLLSVGIAQEVVLEYGAGLDDVSDKLFGRLSTRTEGDEVVLVLFRTVT